MQPYPCLMDDDEWGATSVRAHYPRRGAAVAAQHKLAAPGVAPPDSERRLTCEPFTTVLR